MNYEQKYKKALRVIESLYNVVRYQSSTDALLTFQTLEKAFPELRESEDKKTRKAILELVKQSSHILNPMNQKSMIAWLEKQGEKKHKIQPKFKIGDIIRFKGNETLKGEAEAHKIVGYDNELYVFADGTTDLFCEQDLYELVEQKSAWSEEDEKILKELVEEVKDQLDSVPSPDCMDKEDEKVLKQLNKWMDWLKSLKDRHTWKPSDEQMEALLYALGNGGTYNYEALNRLYNNLKTL